MNEKQYPPSEVHRDERGQVGNQSSKGLTRNSLSRGPVAMQPDEQVNPDESRDPAGNFPAHVVLYQPEIPQNTGNIGRTCVAVGAKLWIVRPAAFRLDDARLRRAGLDYWQHLALGDANNWDDLRRQLDSHRFFFFSRKARRTIWDARFKPGDVFVFGSETSGLPESILDPDDNASLRLPMAEQVRSLNLATTVGVVLYEQQRQLGTSQ